MPFCMSCGTAVPENATLCSTCGTENATKLLPPTGGQTLVIPPPPPPDIIWYVTYATGQRGGPFSEGQVAGMIASQHVKITDSVARQGGAWMPITQSPFARFVVSQASMNRLASSTCPQCGGAMVVVLRRSGASKALLILGLLTIWLFGFGLIFLIIGYIIGRNPVPRYECPICKFKAK